MLFVNRIAHILHSIVVQCDGAANKNIGDAFLLTWKVQANSTASVKDHKYAADKALYSFIKTMVEMIRHEDFLCNFSPRALSELYERMPGYKCRIGCGLHFGWAIEGAIGSSKKIDASYISPHVNMSETLESSTKEYGVPLLMSEPFYNLLSPEAAADCRKVDVLGKSKTTSGLYTYDVDLSVGFTRSEEQEKAKKKETKSSKRQFTLVGDVKKEAHVVRILSECHACLITGFIDLM
jgi:class 3 adenylate cyclase